MYKTKIAACACCRVWMRSAVDLGARTANVGTASHASRTPGSAPTYSILEALAQILGRIFAMIICSMVRPKTCKTETPHTFDI